MKTYITILMFISILSLSSLRAQENSTESSIEDIQLTAKDSMVVSSWIVGIGWNIVDDSGDAFNDFYTVKDQWNAVAFPSRISAGRYFRSGIGLEAIATYNKYKQGNIIDGAVNQEDIDYFAIDSRISYDLNKIFGQTGFFDPYVGGGIGYTDANNTPRGTYNAVIGFRAWFSDRWGIDLSSSGKWSFGNEATNHIQHGIGVIYQFDIEKDLTKKGREKLALIQAMEAEQQRVQDSINEAMAAEAAAAALAEKLAKEKEAARLAALKEAEEQAAKQRLIDLQDRINALGNVYFAFDSSYLSKDAKSLLDKLAIILKEYPDVDFQIASHTDSRGRSEYNLWLSERRANRTVEYLVTAGIAAGRLEGVGYGETQLTNKCSDGVRCTEAEHKENRRSQFEIKIMSDTTN